MDLRQLHHLINLADTGSFSRSAEQLHITQSALSRSIQTLEHGLGARLVDRMGKKNELTPVGQVVVTHARRMIAELDELRNNVKKLNQGEIGSLRIGLGSGPGALLMSPLLSHMATTHPKVKVSISRGPTELQLHMLRKRELDALVIDLRRITPTDEFQIETIVELSPAFICRKNHPLSQNKKVDFDEILKFPIATTPLSDEAVRILINHYGTRAHPSNFATLNCEDVSSLIDATINTDAIFLGLQAAARTHIISGTLVKIPINPPLNGLARFAVLTLRGRSQPPIINTLHQFVNQHLRDQ